MNLWLLTSNLVLLVVVAGLGFVVFSLARQVGVLHERTAPLGLARRTPQVRLGERLPPLVAPNLAGEEVDLDRLAARGHYVAVLFVAPDCPICSLVVPSFRDLPQYPDATLVGYLAGDAAQAEACRKHAAEYGVDPRRYLVSHTLALQLQIRLLPFLVVIDPQGRLAAREVVQGPRALARTLAGLGLSFSAEGPDSGSAAG